MGGEPLGEGVGGGGVVAGLVLGFGESDRGEGGGVGSGEIGDDALLAALGFVELLEVGVGGTGFAEGVGGEGVARVGVGEGVEHFGGVGIVAEAGGAGGIPVEGEGVEVGVGAWVGGGDFQEFHGLGVLVLGVEDLCEFDAGGGGLRAVGVFFDEGLIGGDGVGLIGGGAIGPCEVVEDGVAAAGAAGEVGEYLDGLGGCLGIGDGGESGGALVACFGDVFSGGEGLEVGGELLFGLVGVVGVFEGDAAGEGGVGGERIAGIIAGELFEVGGGEVVIVGGDFDSSEKIERGGGDGGIGFGGEEGVDGFGGVGDVTALEGELCVFKPVRWDQGDFKVSGVEFMRRRRVSAAAASSLRCSCAVASLKVASARRVGWDAR